MSLELIDVVATIRDVKLRKKGIKDDSPLVVILVLGIEAAACEVLPYFDPTLRHFLYTENDTRFGAFFKSMSWSQAHLNMEIDIAGLTLQASKLDKYKISPYKKTGEDDADTADRLWLSAQAVIQLGSDSTPINILSEMINTETLISIRPSQLNLLDEQK